MSMDDVDKMFSDAALACERAVNIGGVSKKPFLDGLCGMHRTLQNTFFSEIVLGMVRRKALDFDAGNYDMRNEAACKLAKVMWEAVKKECQRTDDSEIHLACI